MNDYYSIGKSLLDKGEFDKAKTEFTYGITSKDPKCFYGMLAANAMQGLEIANDVMYLAEHLDDLRALFDDNDADAAFILGRCYEMGIVLPREMHSAIRYYSIAKERGNSDAMFNLGCIYLSQGINDQKIAEEYFIPSAELNNPNACFALGFYYESKEERKLALAYYEKAALFGNLKMRKQYNKFALSI